MEALPSLKNGWEVGTWDRRGKKVEGAEGGEGVGNRFGMYNEKRQIFIK